MPMLLKSMRNLIVSGLFSLLCLGVVHASPIDTYTFPDEVTKLRFQDLTYELRCPKCQNQNLADSNSPISADLRAEVYDMLMAGKSDTEIMNFMVERYGDFVLYRPKVNSTTYILWFGPAVFVLIGAGVIFLFTRKRPEQVAQLSEEQKQQLKSILKD